MRLDRKMKELLLSKNLKREKNLLNVSKKRRMNKPKKESMPINVQSGEIPTLPNATSYQLKIQKKYEDYLEKLNSTTGGLPVRSPLRSPRVKKKSNSPLKKNVGIKSSLYAPVVRDGSSVNSYNNNVMIPQKAQKISSSVYGSLASNLDHDDTQAETKSILSSNYK